MTDFTEAPFSANFNLYGPDALRVQFTVRSNTDPAAHIALVGEYLQAAAAAGYAATLPGLEPGEETEEVDAWVLGETSRDEPCVYLYSSNHGLKWRVATVYVERLGELPFKIDLQQKRWMGAAPERETAEKKGVLNVVDPFKIVLEPTGKTTEAGNEITRFARVHEAQPAASPAGDETSWQEQQRREHLRPQRNGDSKPSPEDRVRLSSAPDDFFEAAVDLCPRYDHANAAKAALKKLGYTALDKSPEGRVRQLQHLRRYAANRDAGMDEDNAMAAAIPSATETEAA